MVLELWVIAINFLTKIDCVLQMLMNVRRTLVLVESVLITRARTPVSAELAIRAHSPGQNAEVWC